jgi:hypothetical protein
MTLDEYFSTGPARERPIFDVVHAYLETLGPIHVEPVSVGIFLKPEGSGSFVELRPMTKWVAMSFPLPYRLDHERIARRMQSGRGGAKTYHVVNLREPADLDDTVRAWLAESFDYVTA